MADVRRVFQAGMDLFINLGIMDAAIRIPDRDLPEHVLENWEEKIEELGNYLENQMREVQDFAEHFDDQ